jgi:Mg2+/Co2+ transporter CorC
MSALRRSADTVCAVDVRIGVTQATRELSVEVNDDDRDDIKSRVEAALSGASDVLTITDKRGRDIMVPSSKIAYVEVGSADGDRRIGFGG